jgi:hypothetical protein
MGQGKGRRNRITARNEEVEGTYTKGRQIGWIIYRGCRKKERPSNLQKGAVQEGQEDNVLVFEGGTD